MSRRAIWTDCVIKEVKVVDWRAFMGSVTSLRSELGAILLENFPFVILVIIVVSDERGFVKCHAGYGPDGYLKHQALMRSQRGSSPIRSTRF